MRFETTEAFDADYKRLKPEHQRAFRAVAKDKFAAACDSWAEAILGGQIYVWPKSLRVDALTGAAGIWEMTWSFASPDGRATFQLVRVDGEWYCRWRRVGDHGVYRSP